MLTEKEAQRMKVSAMLERYHGNYGGTLRQLREITNSLIGVNEEWAKIFLGEVIHQFGVTHQNMKNWSAALDQLSITACYRSNIGDLAGTAYTLFQIPMCRLARGDKVESVMPDFERAEGAINMAIPEAVEAGDYGTLGDMYQNLAYISQQRGELKQAIDVYYNALAFRIEAGDKRGEGLSLARMAECYAKLRDESNARIRAKAALGIFQKIGDVNRIAQIEEVLRDIEKMEKLMREQEQS